MDTMNNDWTIREGADVYGAEGDKVGKIVAVHPSTIVVEKGFFFPTDYNIPRSAIANIQGDDVYLGVTKEQALNQQWDQYTGTNTYVGADTYPTEATTTGDYATGTTATEGYVPETAATTGAAGTWPDTGIEHRTEGDVTHVEEGETVRVPVYEEELVATKRPVEEGAVTVSKDVTAEDRVLEVPVTEERVRVTRRAVDREATAADDAFQEGTIEVPVRGEDVDVQKRVRVAEEVDISKEAEQRTKRVAGTVRREQVHVEGDEDVENVDTTTDPAFRDRTDEMGTPGV
ncbi:MAG TPA: DUF2382 domain-containing protein [Thermomicrobiales bacterium]|nr:DUF2382 domain-containing protein [Thermomicrobiales bacterium]